MKLFNIFKKPTEAKRSGGFSDFFLHANEEEKRRVIEEAARRANEDQRRLVEQYEAQKKTA
ncbi:hypothetical protein HYW17_04655 [Candidatus Uhrbacteria bacterium]|nr:hypothetical protein [Candidatus Uhrbacteria bacterium]